jgi:ketopantoate hydroxymethyltransferase
MPTVQDLRSKAGEEPITMLTAYDAPSAEIVDDTEIDVVLVGDSVGNARLGNDSTLPVTVDEIVPARARSPVASPTRSSSPTCRSSRLARTRTTPSSTAGGC